MVGRVTLNTPTTGLPAISPSFPDDGVVTSGPATGCGSGTAPGHIGTCVCPGDGCQAGVCALRPPDANTTQRAKSKGFITIPSEAGYSKTTSRLKNAHLVRKSSTDEMGVWTAIVSE